MAEVPQVSPYALEPLVSVTFCALAVQTGADLDLEKVADAPCTTTLRDFQRHTAVDTSLNILIDFTMMTRRQSSGYQLRLGVQPCHRGNLDGDDTC